VYTDNTVMHKRTKLLNLKIYTTIKTKLSYSSMDTDFKCVHAKHYNQPNDIRDI